jgi:hypothetical protein
VSPALFALAVLAPVLPDAAAAAVAVGALASGVGARVALAAPGLAVGELVQAHKASVASHSGASAHGRTGHWSWVSSDEAWGRACGQGMNQWRARQAGLRADDPKTLTPGIVTNAPVCPRKNPVVHKAQPG